MQNWYLLTCSQYGTLFSHHMTATALCNCKLCENNATVTEAPMLQFYDFVLQTSLNFCHA